MSSVGLSAIKTGGLACLLRQFETRIDGGGVYDRQPQKPVPTASFRKQNNPKTGSSQSDAVSKTRPDITPGSIEGKVTTPPERNVFSSALQLSSPSDSSKNSVCSTSTKADGVKNQQDSVKDFKIDSNNNTNSQQTKSSEGMNIRKNSLDENPILVSVEEVNSPTMSPKYSSSVLAEEIPDSSVPGAGDRVDDSRSQETISALRAGSNPCTSTIMEIDDLETKAGKGAKKVTRTRFIFQQSSKEPQNLAVDSSSESSSSNKVKQLAKSMDNLCTSPAITPIKEFSNFHVGKPVKNNQAPSTAPAALTSSTTSVSLIGDDKPFARAKKAPPPPVPKKGLKNSRDALDQDSNPTPVQSPVLPQHVGESQTLPNISQTKKPTRPTTLFPEGQSSSDGDVVEDRSKSLPDLGDPGVSDKLAHPLLPSRGQKNTLYPCNRLKSRGQILSLESGKSDDSLNSSTDLSPVSSFGNSVDFFQDPTLPSPMSLGTRTPPNIDSLVNTPDKHLSDLYSPVLKPSSLSRSDQSSMEMNTNFPKDHFSSHSPPVKSGFDVSDSGTGIDSESFVSDAFDFLGSSNSAENEVKGSSLDSWTDTWCRSAQKRLSRISDSSGVPDDRNLKKSIISKDKSKPETSGITKTNIKAQDEKSNKGKNNRNSELNKNPAGKSSDGKNKTQKSTDVEPGPVPQTHFGVVLRRSDAPSSITRRSSLAISSVHRETSPLGPLRNSTRQESFIGRPVSRKSIESFRLSNRNSMIVSRKPSAVSNCSSVLPLTIVPSQTTPMQGKFLGGRTSIRDSSAGTSDSVEKKVKARNEQDSEVNSLADCHSLIDSAFNFLDNSGA